MAQKQDSTTTVSAPPRPTISLPPRPSLDAVFGPGASPGPMTLVSRFFDSYPDPEYRSFSQLLAGAMQSPLPEGGGADAGEKSLGFKQSRPVSLVVAQPSFFTVPPGLSPSGLLNSPGFFSPQSPFGMSHQQALAQVTAQAAFSQSHLHFDNAYASSLAMVPAEQQSTYHPSFTSNATTNQQMQPLASYPKSSMTQSSTVSSSDVKSQPPCLVVDKPADDGFNWRKYGQKQVKGSEYPRSYYKCTYLNCPVKKQVERSVDGQISEIIYRGQHNHEQPQPNRRAKDGSDLNGNIDPRSNETVSARPVPVRDQESTQAASIQLSRSSNHEEVDTEMKTEDNDDDDEPNPKRRNIDTGTGTSELASSQKTMAEAKIIVQTRSEVDLLDDGYRWRKYGQKVVKGNPHPRSYYKCTYAGCNVRKHVERASTDPKAVITTYEGKHNHDLPAARTSSHNTANNNVPQLKAHAEKHALLKDKNYGNEQRPAVLQLKEEHVLV